MYLKNLKLDLPYDPLYPISGYRSKGYEISIPKRHLHCLFMFIVALFTIGKIWNHSRSPSTDERIKKLGIYTQ
jgi:hypothetical protein